MRRFIILFVTLTLVSLFTPAKMMRRTLSILSNCPETETISTGTTEFVYNFRCCVDTTETLEENYVSDDMLLQIGASGLSKFSSLKNLTVDSLMMALTSEQMMLAANEGKLAYGEFMTIYKNYPEGKLTHTDKICQDWFRYEEDMPSFEWELTDSIENVLGYECIGARCSWRGREWIAFYTEEIPIMEGPWKLHGLPGLIMKASDADDEYSFECKGIKSKSTRPISIYKVPFNNVKRKELYDTKHRYDVNPYAYFETTTGGHITVTDEAGNPALDAYDPMEITYDYIEKDWRK